MSYCDTDFLGCFKTDKKLDSKTAFLVRGIGTSRRMKRDVGPEYGEEGEFYIDGVGHNGGDWDETIVDQNEPPGSQPSLNCPWWLQDDNQTLKWDGIEGAYSYISWLRYLIKKIIKPNGFKISGDVKWQNRGELEDKGVILIKNNRVSYFTDFRVCCKYPRGYPIGEYYPPRDNQTYIKFERQKAIEAWFKHLFNKYQLLRKGWKFEFSKSRIHFSSIDWKSKKIIISWTLSIKERMNTIKNMILYEIVKVMIGPNQTESSYNKKSIEIGCDWNACIGKKREIIEKNKDTKKIIDNGLSREKILEYLDKIPGLGSTKDHLRSMQTDRSSYNQKTIEKKEKKLELFRSYALNPPSYSTGFHQLRNTIFFMFLVGNKHKDFLTFENKFYELVGKEKAMVTSEED